MPPQNLTQTGRVGDSVMSEKIILRMMINQYPDRPNVSYRYVFYSAPQAKAVAYSTGVSQFEVASAILQSPAPVRTKNLQPNTGWSCNVHYKRFSAR